MTPRTCILYELSRQISFYRIIHILQLSICIQFLHQKTKRGSSTTSRRQVSPRGLHFTDKILTRKHQSFSTLSWQLDPSPSLRPTSPPTSVRRANFAASVLKDDNRLQHPQPQANSWIVVQFLDILLQLHTFVKCCQQQRSNHGCEAREC